MSQHAADHGHDHYYVPAPSTYPITGSIALLFMGFGAAFSVNRLPLGYGLLTIGFAILFYMIFVWFRTVARESESGKFSKQVDKSFRWGMSWFIFSEVMFFAAFFGALYYMRAFSIPWLSDMEHKLLWPDFTGEWPTAGPGIKEKFMPMGPWGLPAINTLILLTSGVTVTWAHWAL
ncbi:MAG: cytochrome c oxidase subunit 3, partial [Nitrosospira sp.]|nr:cytochrome c oxidase subunit 3 [Nitrosospira sp.]